MRRIIAATVMTLAGFASAADEDEARAAIGDTRFEAGDQVVVDERVYGHMFVAAGRVAIRARVDKSAFVSGGDVSVSGSVGRNVYAAGGDVRIEGEIEGRLRAAGGTVQLLSSARVDDDATLAGASIVVDGEVGDRLRAFGESIAINGTIFGDVEVAGESIRIGPDAHIYGRVEYRSGSDVQVDPAATIDGGVMEVDREKRWLRRVGHGAAIVGGITLSLGIVLIGALMILLAPRFSREAAGAVQSKPLQSLGLGFVLLIGIPLAIIVLLVTIIGIPLALLLGFGYALLLLLGHLVGAIFLGDFALGKAMPPKLKSSWWRVLFLFLALIVIAIVKEIPVLGGFAVFLLFLAGIGAFAMRSWQGFRRDPEAPAAA